MTRPVRPALLGVAAALTLAACAAPGAATTGGGAGVVPELAPDQRVAITWESYNLASAGIGADTVTELVRRFEEAHPNIDVTAQAPQGGTMEFTQSIQRQLVAGDAPDVGQIVFSDLRFAVSDLGVQSLDALVGSEVVDAHLTAGEHPMHPRAAVLGDLDGTTYGIPYVFSTPVLFYNADLFRAAGLDPERPPATWAEVEAAAVAISTTTDAGGVHVGCVAGGDWCMHGIVRSAGGRMLSEDATAITWADPPAVEAVATMQRIAAAGPRTMPNSSANDALDAFQRGRLGMFLNTSVYQSALLEGTAGVFELRAAGMPGFDGPAVPTNSGSALFVLATDPAEQRASWELIEYLTGPEAQTLITENIGYVPLRSSLVDDPAFLKPFADERRDLVEPNVAQLDRLEPWVSFPGPDYNRIRTLHIDAVDEIVFRGADPAAALAEAQRRATELLPGS